jgi:hypothetical protein
MTIPAGRTDVPLSDVPHAGTSNRKRSKKTPSTPAAPEGRQASDEATERQQEDSENRIPKAFDYIQPLIKAMGESGITVSWQMQPEDIQAIARVQQRAGVPAMVEFARVTKASAGQPIRYATFFLRGGWKGLPPASTTAPRPAPPQPAEKPPHCGDIDCDPIDRMRELETPDGLRINTPCHRCHPASLNGRQPA